MGRLIATVAVTVTLASGAAAHPVDFWRAIVRNKYEPPPESDVVALASELSDLLGSPDPELRDEIAYSTLATWIYQTRILAPDVVHSLSARWLDNLTDHIGESGTDRVLRRSFSALMLSVVVARDNAASFLSEGEFHRIERGALDYFAAERDLRGYDPVKGWMHSAAHTADLLKFLGRSRYIDAGGQTRILDAVADKCARADRVFTFGEDERIARAVLSLVNRQDFDRAAFERWATTMRPGRFPEKPSPEYLTAAQNGKNVLAKLAVLLSAADKPSPSSEAAHRAVMAALKDLF